MYLLLHTSWKGTIILYGALIFGWGFIFAQEERVVVSSFQGNDEMSKLIWYNTCQDTRVVHRI